MKLVVLVVTGLVILVAAAVSYYHYTWWNDHRSDGMILDAAKAHDLDPALVKALIRTQFELSGEANNGRRGLMLITAGMLESYRTAHNITWGYICPHRDFRNHDHSKPELYTSAEERQTCKSPGCGARLIEEPLDPKINLEIGCWSLNQMRTLLQRSDPGLSSNEIKLRMLVAYRYGLPRGTFAMTDEQERFVHEVIRRQLEYGPTFERLARRRAAR